MGKMASALVLLAACIITSPASAMPKIGQPAPNFHLKTFDGRDLTLADFRGDVLIVNFWATWCGPCKAELPLLDAYYRAQQKFGLRVVAVTVENDVPKYALKKLSDIVSFPLARGFRGGYGALEGVPTNYVIDRAGVVRYAKAEAFSLDDLNAILVPLLREPAPVVADGS
jgi:thiol-disulfide isomerase/thioredoxin